jgi:ketosteroid isomerase-like protein
MPNAGLEETIQGFFEAFNRGDLDAVMALYEKVATMVAQPGQMAEDRAAIREALNRFLAIKPTLTPEKIAGHCG